MNFLVTVSRDAYHNQKKVRKAYSGYITRLANHLATSNKNKEISNYLKENAEWEDYVENILKNENRRNEMALGGRRVISEADEAKEDCEDHLVFESSLAAVFNKLKGISFDPIPEPIPETKKVVEAEATEVKNENEYLDSQYWQKTEMYTIENIEDEFE